MKYRIASSVIICLLSFLITTVIVLVVIYISSASPNMTDSMFIPASVIDVPKDQDVVVNVYPISMVPKVFDGKRTCEIDLNNIEKGWITNNYDGKCRLVFERRDSSLVEILKEDGLDYYFYAEIIPQQRLRYFDLSEFFGANKSVPYSSDYMPQYYPDSVKVAISNYFTVRLALLCWIIFNIGITLTVILINKHLIKSKSGRI